MIVINEIGLGGVGESVVRSLFSKIDKNHNGKLDFSEAFELVKVIKDLIKSKPT